MTDVTFDTETTGLDPWYAGARPFMVQCADDQNPNGQHALMGPASSDDIRVHLAKLTLERASRVVAHNLPFDVHQLWCGPGWDLLDGRRLADTNDLLRIVHPERRFAGGYKLKDLAKDLVDPNAKDGEEELERLAKRHGFSLKAKPGSSNYVEASYFELWKLEPAAMEFYGREDVRLTLGLLKYGESKLTEGTRRIWELEQQVAPIIIGAERQGICVDQDALAPLRKKYQEEAAFAREALDLQLMEGWDQNNDILAEALQKVGVPLTETTDSGQLAVNQKALGGFVDQHPIIQSIFDYRTKNKFVTTYLDHMGHPVIHPSFWQIGAWTGRMSGSRPNLQNVPAHAGTEIRELYVPREGMAFVSIDFEQIELRLLGYYLHEAELTAIIEGSDFFAWVASEIYGGRPEDYAKSGPKGAVRQDCKNATYAIVYGVGGLKLGRMLGWPVDAHYTPGDWVVRQGFKQAGDPRCLRAETFIKQIKQTLKGYGKPHYNRDGIMQGGLGLQGRVSLKVAETGAVDTILGRHQWVGYDGAWKALSGLIQGGAADLFKLALTTAVPAVKHLGAYPLLFIHDEVVFECPADSADEVLRVAAHAMETSYDLTPRLAADGAIGYKNWGECK